MLFDPQADPRSAGIDPVIAAVAINEISATGAEYVELSNPSGAAQSIAGFGVADADADGGPRFDLAARFSAGAMLAAGGRITVIGGFHTPAQGPQSTCIAGVPICIQAAWDISASRGETVFLLTPGDLIADQVTYPPTEIAADQSWSRLPDGTGAFSVGASSPNRANVGP